MSGNRESLGTVLSGHRIYSEDTHGATKHVRKILTMCNEKKLYQPNEEIFSPLVKMGRGGKMTFKQIYTTTNSIRLLANRMNMPMTDMVTLLQKKELLKKLYKLVKERPTLTHIQIANKLYRELIVE